MSSDPNASGEQLSEFVRTPTRTAGDLSKVAEGQVEFTTEERAPDLEPAASTQLAPSEKELLEELLRRVQRIEEHLGIASAGPSEPV